MSSSKFEVWNVNDEREVLSKGVMEITSSDLIYTFSGTTQIIVWSMKYLRRMGCDGSIFYFEAGRKCSTGEGLYAFKCERASELHHIVCTRCGILASQIEDQSSLTRSLAKAMTVPSHRSDIKFCTGVREPPKDHEVGIVNHNELLIRRLTSLHLAYWLKLLRRSSSERGMGQEASWIDIHSERLAHQHPCPVLSGEDLGQGERGKKGAGRSEGATVSETSETLHYDYVINGPRVFLKTQPGNRLDKTSTLRSGYDYAWYLHNLYSRISQQKCSPGPKDLATSPFTQPQRNCRANASLITPVDIFTGDVGYDIAWDFSRLQPLMMKRLQSELPSI